MAIALGDEGQRLGTRPTRMRTGQDYAHTNRNEEPELCRGEVPKLSPHTAVIVLTAATRACTGGLDFVLWLQGW